MGRKPAWLFSGVLLSSLAVMGCETCGLCKSNKKIEGPTQSFTQNSPTGTGGQAASTNSVKSNQNRVGNGGTFGNQPGTSPYGTAGGTPGTFNTTNRQPQFQQQPMNNGGMGNPAGGQFNKGQPMPGSTTVTNVGPTTRAPYSEAGVTPDLSRRVTVPTTTEAATDSRVPLRNTGTPPASGPESAPVKFGTGEGPAFGAPPPPDAPSTPFVPPYNPQE